MTSLVWSGQDNNVEEEEDSIEEQHDDVEPWRPRNLELFAGLVFYLDPSLSGEYTREALLHHPLTVSKTTNSERSRLPLPSAVVIIPRHFGAA